MATQAVIRVVELVAEARKTYGPDFANAVYPDGVPEDDWRIEVVTDDGHRATFHRGADARHVARYFAERGWEVAADPRAVLALWGADGDYVPASVGRDTDRSET
jgi:hypothetical protein